MVFKCKICGGNLAIQENKKTAVCEYCGTEQVLPKNQKEQNIQLLERANQYRRNHEYDKAMAIYESMLSENITDSEVYWQLVLCDYGVEYVKDRKSNTYLPTCNRTKTISVLADDNYKNALQYAEEEQKRMYEEEAKKIDIIQKNALEISRKEEPFDIFICYKETDENGKRTQDSVIAQDLYNNLTQQGYKVFFSKITLESKLGTQYEPYIFSALNSAKVMIVVGTKKEYLHAAWVRNEWSRFLALKKENAQKILIPTYKEMNPYDLPEEFSHLQALDLGKIGVLTDLKEKIDASLSKHKKSKNTTKNDAKKESKFGKYLVRLIIIVLGLLMVSMMGFVITEKMIIPKMQYQKAEDLMKEEKYGEAIAILEEIKDYKNSEEKIVTCNNKIREQKEAELAKYIGIYNRTEEKEAPWGGDKILYGYELKITEANSAGIYFELTHGGNRVATISVRAKPKEDKYEFSFKDSWLNTGKGTLTLLEDGVKFDLKITKYDEMANWSIGEGEVEFKFSDRI